MNVTPQAQARLAHLLKSAGAAVRGLRFEGHIGTCRASAPMLRPVPGPRHDDDAVELVGDVTLYIPAEHATVAADATLDYEPALLGRGLFLTWPHRPGCRCQH